MLVIGGGAAGMEAALIAASRGHDVTLFEKNEVLGGGLNLAGLCPGGDPYLRYRAWLERECLGAGVTVKLSAEATLDTVLESDPDTVIFAVGAQVPVRPAIKGIDVGHVVEEYADEHQRLPGHEAGGLRGQSPSDEGRPQSRH